MNVTRVAAGLAMLATVAAATPARALVIEVSTSVAVEDAGDRATLTSALQRAVDDVLDGTTFTPTLVMLTRAVVVGGRLHVRLLLADEAGAQSARDLPAPEDDPAAAPATPRTDI